MQDLFAVYQNLASRCRVVFVVENNFRQIWAQFELSYIAIMLLARGEFNDESSFGSQDFKLVYEQVLIPLRPLIKINSIFYRNFI